MFSLEIYEEITLQISVYHIRDFPACSPSIINSAWPSGSQTTRVAQIGLRIQETLHLQKINKLLFKFKQQETIII